MSTLNRIKPSASPRDLCRAKTNVRGDQNQLRTTFSVQNLDGIHWARGSGTFAAHPKSTVEKTGIAHIAVGSADGQSAAPAGFYSRWVRLATICCATAATNALSKRGGYCEGTGMAGARKRLPCSTTQVLVAILHRRQFDSADADKNME